MILYNANQSRELDKNTRKKIEVLACIFPEISLMKYDPSLARKRALIFKVYMQTMYIYIIKFQCVKLFTAIS